MILLNGVEATGAGVAFNMGEMCNNFTVEAIFTNSGGSVTALTVVLEGSLDGTNWYALATHVFSADELVAKVAMFHVVNKSVIWVRGNITTLTETGTTTVTVKFERDIGI